MNFPRNREFSFKQKRRWQSCPICRHAIPRRRHTHPVNYPPERNGTYTVSILQLAWRQVERRDIRLSRAGLYRFSHRFHRDSYFLCWREHLYRMPRANAVYVLLRRARRAVLRYDPHSQTLRVPAICRPPRLLERGLVLCSGLPPSYSTADANLVYSDISPEIANFASELLRQTPR